MRNLRRIASMSSWILLVLLISFPLFASRDEFNQNVQKAIHSGQKFISNSYIIGFKKPSPFIQEDSERFLNDPPDESQRGTGNIPFGEPSTKQSKENLAGMMGLRGEVLAILETINAVHVMMDEDEAERWRKDDRVEYVEQDMIITSGTTQSNSG